MTAITFRFPARTVLTLPRPQILSDVFSSQRGKLYDLVSRKGKALFAEFAYDTHAQGRLGLRHRRFPGWSGFNQFTGSGAGYFDR